MKLLKIIVIFLIILPAVIAKSGHMSLLTVSGDNQEKGGIADLYLEIKPGKGTIFIDSFPLTKLDTQISTRFANEIACDFLQKDCSKYDFFYTIRAKASIVGGPSAGGPITILTIAVLSDLELDKNTIMTGTINSGGLIGPVAGIDEKIDAAIEQGFTKVLIPKWQSTVNITKIEDKNLDKKITIVKVKNIEEALYHLTGKDFSTPEKEVFVSEEYTNLMKEVSKVLCDRSQDILKNIDVESQNNNSIYTFAEGFMNRSIGAGEKANYYSKASFCFSANLRLRNLELSDKSQYELKSIYNELVTSFEKTSKEVENEELISLSDLETYMIVQERLLDAKNRIEDLEKNNVSYSELAYAKERLFSAVAWSEFFALKGEKVNLNDEHLQTACLKKIAEAEERVNYAEFYIPGLLNNTKEGVQEAIQNHKDGEYELCIFKASKGKAEANIILTAISIHEDDLEKVLEEKLAAIKKVILKQEENNIFPILGYSYFEYANSLIEYDVSSSLTFAEYALELSNLDMYFPKNNGFSIYINPREIQLWMFGFVVGISVAMLLNLRKRKVKKHRKKKK